MSKFFRPTSEQRSCPFQLRVDEYFAQAGIQINGSGRYEPQIHNQHFYPRFIRHGDLALGESYMEGWWDCAALDEFICKLVRYHQRQTHHPASLRDKLYWLRAVLLPIGRAGNAYNIAHKHYDLDSRLFASMLDQRMTYSCAFWEKSASNLEQAQEHKFDLICQKLQLEAGMSLLDCGSGWGSFAGFAAEHYGVTVTAINVSVQQVSYCQQRYAHLPISFLLQDYRQHQGCYDRIVSIGMIEHVGPKFYRSFIEKMRQCVTDDGLMLLHSIGNNHSKFQNDWLAKYIFPDGFVPSLTHLSAAVETLFVIEDVQNLSVNYDKTLMAWHENFENNWPEISEHYSQQFYRMWRFYLLSCAAMFRARELQVFQLLLSPYGLDDGYQR